MMVLFLLSFVAFLAHTNANPIDSNKWVFVPTRNGLITRVNLAEAMAQVEPYFSVEQDVTFELYTLKNKITPQILLMDNVTSITASNFNRNVPTRIYVHGFLEYGGNMKKIFNDAFLSKAKVDVNLIYVNWEKSSQTINYIAARNRVESIGAHVAAMIDYMAYHDLVSINDISLIGFSLGAHIAGIAGKHVQTGKLPKIIGLDPAGPLFSLNKPNERLDRLDAKYVEIIHTNGAFLGMHYPIGTVSFYPNHGLKQTGCLWDPTGTCSHLRAFKYFAESIYSTVSFYAYPCASFEDMKKGNCKGVGLRMGGEPGNYNAEASIYYLTTNSKSIFARGGSRDM
ncbi:inactive pancreatic lipase-related protein 1-like [Sitodiplosis mosellana]|uniref:inactive pancreatic lipase-related protein 1-like n=1 Tax=Sitodiplosis mosellana TaxID=263140 RepID=UPI002444AAAC|nr:inactive pancreatic lipase-related protein 1-like [Sitodiplosis mosellana]